MSTQSSREAWTCALELSRALGERGLAVTLATLGAPLTLAQWAEARDVPGLRVEQSVWRSEDMPDAWDDVAEAGAWLLELEARYLPDVVHLNGYCHGALPWKRWLEQWLQARQQRPLPRILLLWWPRLAALGLLVLSYMQLLTSTFNPFIYFRF